MKKTQGWGKASTDNKKPMDKFYKQRSDTVKAVFHED